MDKVKYCLYYRYCNSHLQQLGQAPVNSKAAKARERKPSSAASKVCTSQITIASALCYGQWFWFSSGLYYT